MLGIVFVWYLASFCTYFGNCYAAGQIDVNGQRVNSNLVTLQSQSPLSFSFTHPSLSLSLSLSNTHLLIHEYIQFITFQLTTFALTPFRFKGKRVHLLSSSLSPSFYSSVKHVMVIRQFDYTLIKRASQLWHELIVATSLFLGLYQTKSP